MTGIDVTPATDAATAALYDGWRRWPITPVQASEVAVTAALPHLAEQFARLVSIDCIRERHRLDLTVCMRCSQVVRVIREAATKTDDGAAPVCAGQSHDGVHLPTPDGEPAPSSPDRIEAVAATLRVHLGYLAPERAAAAVAALDAYDGAHIDLDAYVAWRRTEADLRERIAAEAVPIIRAFIVESVGFDAGPGMTLQAEDLAARIVRGGAATTGEVSS